MNRHIRAFTLIEVLVALLIIAIACVAVIKAMTEGIEVSTHLQQSVVSRWVAQNTLSQLQNGMLPSMRDNTEQDGNVTMWRRQWHWVAKQDVSTPYYQRVVITVGPPNSDRSYYRLVGFIWQPQASQRGGG